MDMNYVQLRASSIQSKLFTLITIRFAFFLKGIFVNLYKVEGTTHPPGIYCFNICSLRLQK